MFIRKKTHLERLESQTNASVAIINQHKEEIARLEKKNQDLKNQIEELQNLVGSGHEFKLSDLRAGMKVFHFEGFRERTLVENPKGKFELLFQEKNDKWESTAMGQVDSLQEVLKYMKSSRYVVKK